MYWGGFSVQMKPKYQCNLTFQTLTLALIRNLIHCADAFQSLQICAQDEQDYTCYTPLTLRETCNSNISGQKTEKPLERFLIISLEIQTKNRPIISD